MLPPCGRRKWGGSCKVRGGRSSKAVIARESGRSSNHGTTGSTGCPAFAGHDSMSGGERRLRHRLLEVFVDLVEEAAGGQPLLIGTDQQRQVLGHEAGFHGVDPALIKSV